MSKEELKKFAGQKESAIISRIRASKEKDIKLSDPDQFYKDMNKPVNSPAYDFFEKIKADDKTIKVDAPSRIMEFDGRGNWRWRKVNSAGELKKAIKESEDFYPKYLKLKEQAELDGINEFRKKRSSFYEGFDTQTNPSLGQSGPSAGRQEFSPLISSPFFKQLYLYDYLLMHSKCFWYKNYSGIAKAIIEITRNFVIGDGFSVNVEDEKAKQLWEQYEDDSKIHDRVPVWCDEACFAGELMIKRIPKTGGKILHKSIDPSTIWEIVTEPTDIEDVKYYHQQYNTQYQIFNDKNTPMSAYVMNQIPPTAVIHEKFNCTSWEKRGRSDLLACLLYLKHFDDAVLAKLIRYKVEMSTVWDVTIKGSAEDISAYLAGSESVSDVPPNSENVHNEALTRLPLSPTLGRASDDAVINWIMAYVALSVNIPGTWLANSMRGETKASAVVKTEPVIRKMMQRRKRLEAVLNQIFDDVMMAGGIKDPKKIEREFSFPDMVTDNRSQRIQDTILARDNGIISHELTSHIVSQQLDITNYDFDKEQAKIAEEKKEGGFPEVGTDLTDGGVGSDTNPRFDRSAARGDNGISA